MLDDFSRVGLVQGARLDFNQPGKGRAGGQRLFQAKDPATIGAPMGRP